MKIKQIRLLVMLFTLSASPVFSQDSIYDRCLAAIEADDTNVVQQLAATMARFTTHPAQNIPNAEECVSAAQDEPLRWMAETSAFVPASTFEQQRDAGAREREIRDRAQANQEKQIEDSRRQARREEAVNQALIAQDIFMACNQLYVSEFNTAMTSPTCIESFRVNGHPLLDEELQD